MEVELCRHARSSTVVSVGWVGQRSGPHLAEMGAGEIMRDSSPMKAGLGSADDFQVWDSESPFYQLKCGYVRV